jgi:hypothetical protein
MGGFEQDEVLYPNSFHSLSEALDKQQLNFNDLSAEMKQLIMVYRLWCLCKKLEII